MAAAMGDRFYSNGQTFVYNPTAGTYVGAGGPSGYLRESFAVPSPTATGAGGGGGTTQYPLPGSTPEAWQYGQESFARGADILTEQRRSATEGPLAAGARDVLLSQLRTPLLTPERIASMKTREGERYANFAAYERNRLLAAAPEGADIGARLGGLQNRLMSQRIASDRDLDLQTALQNRAAAADAASRAQSLHATTLGLAGGPAAQLAAEEMSRDFPVAGADTGTPRTSGQESYIGAFEWLKKNYPDAFGKKAAPAPEPDAAAAPAAPAAKAVAPRSGVGPGEIERLLKLLEMLRLPKTTSPIELRQVKPYQRLA